MDENLKIISYSKFKKNNFYKSKTHVEEGIYLLEYLVISGMAIVLLPVVYPLGFIGKALSKKKD
jgi:hypothetical protein